MRSIIQRCVQRPIGTLMLFIGTLVVSLIVASGLGVEFLPDVRMPKLIVSTSFPGLPASEVRVLVTIPIEDALSSLKGIKRISSVSREGVSTVTLEFHWGTNMQAAAVETREIIDVVYPALPSETRKPMVLPVDPGEEPVMLVGVFAEGGDLAFVRRIAEREVKTRLQQVTGVGSITVVGGTRDEVKVLVDQQKMAGRGLTLEDIAGALADANFDYPAGSIREGATEYLVKAKGTVERVPMLGGFYLGGGKGPRLQISDVTTEITLGTAEQVSLFQVDGKEGVGLSIRRRQGTSPVALSAGVTAELERISRSYTRDLEFRVVHDSSRFISNSLRDLILSIAVGAAIAFLVVLFFVRDFSASLILISSVPISILVSLLFLRLFGRTINVMSIGGMSLGIGMMMDNSVVILENLQKRLILEGRGVTPEGIVEATDEMSGSNVGSTLTSIVVFLPVIFLPGVIGAVFTDLALSVIFCQVVSLVISVTLLPVLFRMLAGGRRKGLRPGRSRGMERLERLFRGGSRLFLRRPYTLAALILATTAAGVISFRAIPFEFMPAVDTGEIDVTVSLPYGTALSRVSDVSRLVSRRLLEEPGVSSVYARAGGEEDDAFYLADPQERRELLHLKAMLATGRRRRASVIVESLRAGLTVDDADVSVELPENIVAPLLGISGDTVQVKVAGRDQADASARADELAAAIKESAPDASVSVSPSGEKPEIHLVPDRQGIAKTGTSLMIIAQAVRGALEGSIPTRILIDGRETDVRVRLRPQDAANPEMVEALMIRGPDGAGIRLRDLARVRTVSGPPALLRMDRSDAALVEVSRGVAVSRALPELLMGRSYADSMETSALRENALALALTFGLIVLLLYLVLGVQFESFILPLLLLFSLPLSFFGIFAALFITGKSLNFDSILGIIVLFGIAVNNSIVLYENYTERISRITKGGITVAIYRGTPERLRPILITMLSTVMALVPVALDPTQTSTQSSMAVAIIGGLFVSTTLTLFVIPQLFLRYLGRQSGRS